VTAIFLSPTQSIPSLGLLSIPGVEEAPVYYEEDSDEDDEIDSSLLKDYGLLELEKGAPIVSESKELVEIPVTIVSNFYEVEVDEDTDPSLLDEYLLIDLEHGPSILLETVEVTETPSIIPASSSPSPSQTFIMEVRRGEGMAFNSIPTAEARSSPPPKATVAAGWHGCIL